MTSITDRELKITNRLREHKEYIEKLGYELVGIFVQGSQNYNLDIYDDQYSSDIDTKAIVLPTFEDFVDGKEPISTTIILDNNEHIDVKDIRVMFDIFKKSNINYLEILFTKFYILNSKYSDMFKLVMDNAERLAFANMKALLNAICGMSMQKYIALKHPYPTLIDKINKYGYDPKQLHHIYRLNYFMKNILSGKTFRQSLLDHDTETLLNIKKGILPLDEAEKEALRLNEETHNLKDQYVSLNNIVLDEDAYSLYKECKKNILRKWFSEQIKIDN